MAVAVDEAAFDEFMRSAAANDSLGARRMALEGRIYFVPIGTRVRVIDLGMFRSRVRIMEGERVGAAGWVPAGGVR